MDHNYEARKQNTFLLKCETIQQRRQKTGSNIVRNRDAIKQLLFHMSDVKKPQTTSQQDMSPQVKSITKQIENLFATTSQTSRNTQQQIPKPKTIDKEFELKCQPQFVFDTNSQIIQGIYPNKKAPTSFRRPTSALQNRFNQKYQSVSYTMTTFHNPLSKLQKKQVDYLNPKVAVDFDSLINAVSKVIDRQEEDQVLEQILSKKQALKEEQQLQQEDQVSPKRQKVKLESLRTINLSPQSNRNNQQSWQNLNTERSIHQKYPALQNLGQSLKIQCINRQERPENKRSRSQCQNYPTLVNKDCLNQDLLNQKVQTNLERKISNRQKQELSPLQQYRPVFIKQVDLLPINQNHLMSNGLKGSIIRHRERMKNILDPQYKDEDELDNQVDPMFKNFSIRHLEKLREQQNNSPLQVFKILQKKTTTTERQKVSQSPSQYKTLEIKQDQIDPKSLKGVILAFDNNELEHFSSTRRESMTTRIGRNRFSAANNFFKFKKAQDRLAKGQDLASIVHKMIESDDI